MAIMDIIKRLEAEIAQNGPPEPARADDFRKEIEREIDLFLERLKARDLQAGRTWFRTPELELLRDWLTRAVYSRCSGTRPVYNHLLIRAEQELLPAAREFADRFSAAAAEFYGAAQAEFVRFTSVEELLAAHHAAQREQRFIDAKNARILLIPTFNAEKLDLFESALENLGIGSCSVILCTSEEDAEAIRNHTNRDSRLGKYLLHRSYRYTDLSDQDVCDQAFAQLETDGFKLTEEFREALSRYIRAVYPEAVLRKEEFVRDLLIRIEDVRADALRFSSVLTAADVPYSRKAEMMAEARHTESLDRPVPEKPMPLAAASEEAAPKEAEEAARAEAAVPEEAAEQASPAPEHEESAPAITEEPEQSEQPETAEKENDQPIELTAEGFAKLAVQWDGATEWLQKRDQNLKPHAPNILLLALSTFPRENRLEATKFTDDEGVSFTGRYQLDSVPKKISFDLAKEGSAIDYVIMLCTKETERICDVTLKETDKKTYLIKQTSAISLFAEQLRYYLNPSSNEAVRIIRLYREEGNNEEDFATGFRNAVETIRTLISANAEAAGKPALYMDIHGGFRDSQMVFQSIVSLLETDPIDFDINVYSVKFGDKKRGEKSRIVRSDESLTMYQFASGIREVINYGRTQSLEDYLQNNYPHDQTAHKALAILKKIATGIAWCDIKTFEKGIEELSNFDWGENDENSGESKLFLTLFRENIERGYEEILKQKAITEEIRWCLRKGFYQQALALIEAKIPEWFVASHTFIPDPVATDRSNKKIAPVLQFNACVYYAGTSGTKLPARIKQYFKNTKKCIDETDYQFHLKGLPELKNSEELFSKVKTEASSKEMESGSKLNTDFNSRIPAHEMIVFLSLHHVFKDLRNDSMHVKNFEYNVDQVKTAIRYYLDLFDGIRESIQTGVFPVQEKRLNVGDICLASVDKDQAFEYYLTLQDGSIGKLAKKDAILPPKGEKSNTVKERIKVRITSAGNLIKTCTMKDVPQNN